MSADEKRPPIAHEPLSLALTVRADDTPTLNLLQEWVTYLNGSGLDYDLLVAPEQAGVDAAKLCSGFARARAVTVSNPVGYGSALRAMLAKTDRPLVCYGRCQPGIKPGDVKAMLRAIDEVDVVLGVRRGRPRTLGTRCRNWLRHRLLKLCFGLTLEDPGCLFVLARRSIFQRIPIQSTGVFAHLEILAKAHFLECTGEEVPLSGQFAATDPPEPIAADFRRVFAHPEFGAG